MLTQHPCITNLLSYSIPYFTGVFIAEKEAIRKLISKQWVIAGAILSYTILFQRFSFYNEVIWTQVLRIVLSLCVIVVCCKIRENWKADNVIKNIMCIIGKYSLEIYLLHGFFLDYHQLIYQIESNVLGVTCAIIISFGVAFAAIMLAKLLSVSSICRKILFGK